MDHSKYSKDTYIGVEAFRWTNHWKSGAYHPGAPALDSNPN